MRILFAQENAGWGGAENYLVALARALANGGLGDEIHVAAPQGWLGDWAAALGPDVTTHALPRELISRAGLFREIAPDVVHINDPQPKSLLAARLARVPRALTTYHTPSLQIRYNLSGRVAWRLGAAWKHAHFLVLSPENRRRFSTSGLVDPDRIHVVPLGIGNARFEGLRTAAVARTDLQIPPEAFVAVAAGRLEAQKAHEVLLEAFRIALPSLPAPAFLLVAGDGSRMAELKEMARSLGIQQAVRFLGYVESIPQTIAAADLHVLSSDFEGLPAVLLEAMALGVPTVSTNVDGMRDVIADGEGVLVPPRDPASLADALISLASDGALRRAMGHAARARFQTSYTESAMVSQTRSLYLRLLDS